VSSTSPRSPRSTEKSPKRSSYQNNQSQQSVILPEIDDQSLVKNISSYFRGFLNKSQSVNLEKAREVKQA